MNNRRIIFSHLKDTSHVIEQYSYLDSYIENSIDLDFYDNSYVLYKKGKNLCVGRFILGYDVEIFENFEYLDIKFISTEDWNKIDSFEKTFEILESNMAILLDLKTGKYCNIVLEILNN
jgi:hypothetical protein